MIQDFLVPISSHKEKINNYINWLFQKKQEFVILKQYVNKAENSTKMFIAIPVRERAFEVPKKDLFDKKIFNLPTFPFSPSDVKEHKTLYSGDLFEFTDIFFLLSTIVIKKHLRDGGNVTIYRDYTITKEEQLNRYNLVDIGRTPLHSMNSIYRLLHTKYVTIVEVKFKNVKSYES